jgi:hypothetical protein
MEMEGEDIEVWQMLESRVKNPNGQADGQRCSAGG